MTRRALLLAGLGLAVSAAGLAVPSEVTLEEWLAFSEALCDSELPAHTAALLFPLVNPRRLPPRDRYADPPEDFRELARATLKAWYLDGGLAWAAVPFAVKPPGCPGGRWDLPPEALSHSSRRDPA
ncbi:MAG: hypothetical protein AB1758_02390 [Candidatus Eremiobacterota bacterium]